MPASEFILHCRDLLSSGWRDVIAGETQTSLPSLSAELLDDIRSSINSSTQTYRYVLPTQLLAKSVRQDLDCRCVQKKRGGPGAFDARSVAHDVIVPFDREQHCVLGGAAEPYLSKPLRCKEVTATYREDKRDKLGWDALQRVLDVVEGAKNIEFTHAVLEAVLRAIADRLTTVKIVYPVPHRVSSQLAIQVIESFLSRRTGGFRFESVVAAVFETLGRRFSLFSSIRRTSVNAADSQSGTAGDIECLDSDGKVFAVVEAKDRQVTLRQVQDKLSALRDLRIREAFFVTSQQLDNDHTSALDAIVQSEYALGQSIYIVDFHEFLRSILSLFRDDGRCDLCRSIGFQLDQFGRLADRQAWSDLLSQGGRETTGVVGVDD